MELGIAHYMRFNPRTAVSLMEHRTSMLDEHVMTYVSRNLKNLSFKPLISVALTADMIFGDFFFEKQITGRVRSGAIRNPTGRVDSGRIKL